MRGRTRGREWWRGRRAGFARGLLLIAACGAAAVGTACVGVTERDEFDAIIQQRGGGFTSELPLDAVATVAAELRTEDCDVRTSM